MAIVIFEDEGCRHLHVLTHARPTCDLRCGALTLRERVAATLAQLGDEQAQALLCRAHLMECYSPNGAVSTALGRSEPLVLLNARALDLGWLPELLAAPVDTVLLCEGELLGARLRPALASALMYYLRQQRVADAVAELTRFAHVREARATLLAFPWDLVALNGEQIVRDAPLLRARGCLPFDQLAERFPGVVAHRPEQIYVSPASRLDGPIVLDARDGPVIIEDAHVEPFSFIQGPTYVGPGALIASARVRGETSIGPVCRIGGEVEASIVQGYSNKHHDGFLGHSYLGEWVNIGAMTTTSDLKNTYGSIRVVLEGEGQLDSGTIKLGAFLADHVKLGIGLHLTGGSVIGFGSNIFGIHSAPKTVPPFTWGGEVFREYRIDGMVEVARKVMGRRRRALEPAYEAVLRTVFAQTRPSRSTINVGRTGQLQEPPLALQAAE
jgi:UDP-N-acetylglucosamine diphosphorylase/glucosamine-1-phosphate N-acetyltransferase